MFTGGLLSSYTSGTAKVPEEATEVLEAMVVEREMRSSILVQEVVTVEKEVKPSVLVSKVVTPRRRQSCQL